jgi:hypothetical protein
MGSARFSRHRRSQPIAIEPLEGRALLSTVATELPPAVPAQTASPSGGSTTIHVDGNPVHPAVVHQLILHQTAQRRHSEASTADVANVGKQYAKLVFASTTRQVGLDYVKAALRGDGKALKRLGHTNAVKQVGQNFSNLSRSPQVKAVGHKFESFGRAVSHQFHKIFG